MRTQLTAVTLLAFLTLPSASSAGDAGIDFFEKKIRPVLIEHCYKCHSAKKKVRGGLALDTRAGIHKGGDSGPALQAGKPDKSILIQAIRYTDPDLRMPPRGKLPPAVIADLEKWVQMGAPDPRQEKVAAKKPTTPGTETDFWAFQQPKLSPVPEVKDVAWPRNPVDRFLLARLEARGLHPVGEANRATLIRRLTFDLTGLPPTPAAIRAFVEDTSPDAYERVVDRLLASPHFGERWGRHWLDIARFAESSGGGRTLLFRRAWRYRDYVLDAFNKDKPYDRFITEQMAGDLLPASNRQQRAEQLTATAFLVLGPTNYELQDKKVLEMDVVDEQLDTMGRAFMGLTIGCARCHDHKFDPIPTRDYYALAGIMRSTQVLIHSNVSTWMERPLPTSPEQAKALQSHQQAVDTLEEEIKQLRVALRGKGKGKNKGKSGPSVVAASKLPGLVLDDTQAEAVGTWVTSQYNNSYIGVGYQHDDNTDKGKKKLIFRPKLPRAGKYEVRFAYTSGSNRARNVPVTVVHADGKKTIEVNEVRSPTIDGRFVTLGTFRFAAGQAEVIVSNEGTNGHVIADAVQFLTEEEVLALKKAAKAKKTKTARKPAPKTDPRAASRKEKTARLKKLQAQLKRLKSNAPYQPKTMAAKEGKIEDCPLCIRGNYHNRGPQVPRGFLNVIKTEQSSTIPEDASGRLQLARWLSSPRNPLPARVMVNRIWHHLFGAGLVRSTDNFGTRGDRPTHPELLDYLAVRFMQDGWSVKKMVRMLVLSRAYRMSCVDHPQARAIDPGNSLLWRSHRRRLQAEAIQDAILFVSGQLDQRIGGPNIKKGTSIEYGYKFDGTRRAIYTPVFRNTLPELFEVFDFADPNIVVGKRAVSTTSTQALFLMNSPFVMEQASLAAERTLAKTADMSDEDRVDYAYRLTLGRAPSARERQLALAFVTGSREPGRNLEAWARFYQVLFSCLDFRYVN